MSIPSQLNEFFAMSQALREPALTLEQKAKRWLQHCGVYEGSQQQWTQEELCKLLGAFARLVDGQPSQFA